MIHADILFAEIGPMPQWMNFALMGGAIIVSSIIALFVALSFRKRKHHKRKRRSRHSGHRQSNPTLAQIGGLPPRKENQDEPPALS